MNSSLPVPSTPSIAILGAGISGLALAIGLSRRHVPCKIYEASDRFSTIGAGIGLGPNSLAAMDLIDPAFRAKYDSVRTANEDKAFRNSIFDALYAEEGLGEKRGWLRGLVGAPYFERSSAHRKDLLDIMVEFIPDGTVLFEKKAVEVKQMGNKVVVYFADGEQISVDAVIGADGIRGISREAVLGALAPDLVSPKYTGTYAYRGIVPMDDAKKVLGSHASNAKWFMGHGKGAVTYPISKGSQVNFVFFVREPRDTWHEKGGSSIFCTKEEMMQDLKDVDARLKRLLDWAQPLRWPLFHHPETPTYVRGRICMIGDAAHAMTPYQAAGAGQGLEDAVVLSHILAMVKQSDELDAAFQVYSNKRISRAKRAIDTSEEAGAMYMFSDAELGDDMVKIVENANGRLHWLWQHNLSEDLKDAEEQFYDQLSRKVS
ncbi:hypothetical protein N0V93_003072 [Gnomoniopsis smithogilvyi]|uniref:FAD-binding domain-containing protein n=1 Tax=Gnomoniopsis smithogilvyi TaxID=1191159 RepID=A0A9W8YWF1_9PEZI|nr:hypothetical protein N0V93_003072 [Gnomoniopsis smithogilvyi]